MKKFFVLLLAMLMVVSVAACGSQGTSSEGGNEGEQQQNGQGSSDGDTVTIGAVLPMTGPAATFGKKFEQAYTIAIEKVNEEGGINGKTLRIIIEDSQEKANIGMTAAEKLINNDEVLAILGARASGTTYAVAKVASQNNMPMLVEHGSSDKITQSGWENVFRLNPTAGMYTEGMQAFLTDIVKPESIAVIRVDNLFGESVFEYGTKKYAEANGIEIVADEKFQGGTVDFKPIVAKVKEANPDVVVITAGNENDAVQVTKAFKELNYTPKAIIGTGAGHAVQGFHEQGGDLAQYIMTTGPWHGDKKNEEWQWFNEEFNKRYGHYIGEHEAEGYAAIQVMADALRRADEAGELTRDGVMKALDETDMDTIFGHVKFEDFDGYTNQNKSVSELSQWIDGKLMSVYPEEIAETEYVYPLTPWDQR
ncbi:MAG: ABC transporter substrate-binding protein [Bacillaceae bacterium]|nr:ABC transporter substrate-binding protein [Bacillaceae bacterium]